MLPLNSISIIKKNINIKEFNLEYKLDDVKLRAYNQNSGKALEYFTEEELSLEENSIF